MNLTATSLMVHWQVRKGASGTMLPEQVHICQVMTRQGRGEMGGQVDGTDMTPCEKKQKGSFAVGTWSI